MTVNLQVSSTEIENYRKKLLAHFVEVLDTPEEASAKTEEVILKALEGWGPKTPKTLEKRINKLVGFGSESPKGDSKSRTQAEEKRLHEQLSKLLKDKKYVGNLNILFDSYNSEQKKMFLERLNFYYDEFEFNQSSDFAALFSLIADEIRLYVLHAMQASQPTEDFSKELTEAHKRIVASQKMLGITKEQRNVARDHTEGSLTELVMELEKKLKLRAEQKIDEDQKEKELTEIKNNRESEYKGVRFVNRITDGDLKLIKGDIL